MAIIITWLINLTHAIRNGWRRLLRRRVDYVWIELSGALPEFAATPLADRRFADRCGRAAEFAASAAGDRNPRAGESIGGGGRA